MARQIHGQATIATLQEPGSGEIWFDEVDVLKNKDTIRRILGYLLQEFGVYPKISAIDMLNHSEVMKGITATGERKDIVDTLLKQTNLWDVRKKALSGSSGGMKQRFGIAQAPLGNPRIIIIVDEPTAGSILPGVTTFSTCSVPSAATPSSSSLPV